MTFYVGNIVDFLIVALNSSSRNGPGFGAVNLLNLEKLILSALKCLKRDMFLAPNV